jgi:hypothetical protein
MRENWPKLPDHLVDLYEKSSEKLISHKHKVKFAEVLLQNSDAFARNKLDLGTCSMITPKKLYGWGQTYTPTFKKNTTRF